MRTWRYVWLDATADFDAVLTAAILRHGQEVLELLDAPCPMSCAVNRLRIRRLAAGSPEPGEVWGWRALIPLVPRELQEMGQPDAQPCPAADCEVCREFRPVEPGPIEAAYDLALALSENLR